MTDTPAIQLREITESDLEIFFNHEQDSEAAHRMNFASRPRPVFMARFTKNLADPTTFNRTVVVDGEVAGNIACWEQEGERWIGYVYGRDFWGRGIGTAAMREFLELAHWRPLCADPAARNVGSWRLLEKCGFKRAKSITVPDVHVHGTVEHFIYRLD
ncbi:MAG TPA: GNAT family N-acetyltransferase [Stackebrandtia sp.]|jgi:RimJ/RimL family protein N-acetyltransferase|uniref:GNAT family N-acetyltransferase n=1 Tax=Stackebrandtia sp. TaxID=2023065 RepID=UPI002D2E7C5F|nr:GNAT family N-acetyltransferase [Stackebrandtia sp.]HZE39493.1 GNAT family N-acetyltransferase [Stackebrandtia sp.]